MDAREAVSYAKRYVSELFAEENIGEVALEEIDYDYEEDEWKVTIGFTRPWASPKTSGHIGFELPANRAYKQVRMNEDGSKVLSVRDRILQFADPHE